MGVAAADRLVQGLAQRHQEHRRRGVAAGDDDMLARHPVQRRAHGADPVQSGDDGFAVHFARRRQPHAVVNTVEQPMAEKALQFGHGAADRRLGGVKLLGGLAEAPQPRRAFERAEEAHRRQRKGLKHSGSAIEGGLNEHFTSGPREQ